MACAVSQDEPLPVLTGVGMCHDTTVDLALPTGGSGLFTLRSEHTTTTIRALEGEPAW
ncbi:hypothetical protein ACH4YN_37745 [Streptomyces griseofuscus]|uniref:hypothetical protein n=1 Tax=Streptomyces griseofuscus TaxID=146922 RepID=UPI0037AC6EF1